MDSKHLTYILKITLQPLIYHIKLVLPIETKKMFKFIQLSCGNTKLLLPVTSNELVSTNSSTQLLRIKTGT